MTDFTPQDLEQLQARGISPEKAEAQLECFRNGFPQLDIVAPASKKKGILAPKRAEQEQLSKQIDAYIKEQSTEPIKWLAREVRSWGEFSYDDIAAVIEAVVELLETLISYMSNSISFIRVGAFGLAHAVLGFIIATLSEMAGPAYLAVMLVGNGIVVVLEGMIVAIQVIRLQYYEFFSKFFNETGREFKPFSFDYK